MAKNSTEGNKARAARYRAALAARGIHPVQLLAPEASHALLKQAVGLMTREQDPLEPRQALRQASGANDPGEAEPFVNAGAQDLAAEIEAVRGELVAAQEVERLTERRALAEAEAARVEARRAEIAEGEAILARAREAAAIVRADGAERKQEAAEAMAAQARVEADRFQKVPGLRGRVVKWLAW